MIGEAIVSRAPLIVQTFGVSKVEGDEFTEQIATFSDPNGALAGARHDARVNNA